MRLKMNEEISICNPKHTEFDIWNAQPRKVKCVRNDDMPYNVGGNPSVLSVGAEYDVENVHVDSWYTLVKLSGMEGWFNSVYFEELEGYEPVKDSPSKRAWIGTSHNEPGDWD